MATRIRSRFVTIPLDAARPELALDEAVLLVKELGAKVKGLSRHEDQPALVVQLPVNRPAG
jgi:hypothetical protein